MLLLLPRSTLYPYTTLFRSPNLPGAFMTAAIWLRPRFHRPRQHVAILVEHDRAAAHQCRLPVRERAKPFTLQRYFFAPGVFEDDLPRLGKILPAALLRVVEVRHEEIALGGDQQVFPVVVQKAICRGARS